MNRLLLVFILVFGFQSLIKAEGVIEFEIEGISIGDSLLDHYSKKEIETAFIPFLSLGLLVTLFSGINLFTLFT